MATETLESRLTAILEQKAVESGLELVAVEVLGGKGEPLIRVFLDREGGIGIDDISDAGVWIQDVLDVEVGADYTLEASSPGIERKLRKLDDFRRFTGSKAKITTKSLIDGRKNFTGTITGVEDDSISVDVEGTSYVIPFAAVDKARLRVEIDFNKGACDGI